MSQIMKKAILTFGLMSMIMFLTSFTSEIGGETQQKPKEPAPLAFEIGGETQQKPKDPVPFRVYQSEIGGETQQKPKESSPLG
jgi:hypothetical protein